MLDYDGTRRDRRREGALAGGMLLLAFFLLLVPAGYQQVVRQGLRRTVLRPFLAVQAVVAKRRSQMVELAQLRAQRDSLASLVAAQAALWEENRQLRALLVLGDRLGRTFIPAEVLRVGLVGGDGTFLLSVGTAQGIDVGSPVITPEGLLGVVREVDRHTAQAIDWTDPDFRAGAMTEDGEVYGIAEAWRGRSREEDVLVMTGAPFHSDVRPGRRIVTSGRGGIYPRGIPLGIVAGIESADTGWRKSYLVQPAVRPEGAAHVLVGVGRNGSRDLSPYWDVSAPPDTLAGTSGNSRFRGSPQGEDDGG